MNKNIVNRRPVDTEKTWRRVRDLMNKNPDAGLVAELAGRLNVPIEYAPEACDCQERPHFGPKQVRCWHQLKAGRKYCKVMCGSDGTILHREYFTVRKEPFLLKGDFAIEVDIGGGSASFLLSNFSILPHYDGTWQRCFYFTFVDES